MRFCASMGSQSELVDGTLVGVITAGAGVKVLRVVVVEGEALHQFAVSSGQSRFAVQLRGEVHAKLLFYVQALPPLHQCHDHIHRHIVELACKHCSICMGMSGVGGDSTEFECRSD